MCRELEKAIAGVFSDGLPELAESIRELKAKGAPKSDVVALVTRNTKGSKFMRSGLLQMVDELWATTTN